MKRTPRSRWKRLGARLFRAANPKISLHFLLGFSPDPSAERRKNMERKFLVCVAKESRQKT
jgi:hypothetical protein